MDRYREVTLRTLEAASDRQRLIEGAALANAQVGMPPAAKLAGLHDGWRRFGVRQNVLRRCGSFKQQAENGNGTN